MGIQPPPDLRPKLVYNSATRWFRRDDDSTVVIDLSSAQFIDSCGLALVAAEAERACKAWRAVRFVAPSKWEIASYLSRMRLGTLLEQLGIDHALPPVNEHYVGPSLLELQHFTPPDVDSICATIHAAITSEGGSSEDANDFFRAIAEVMVNIEHSATEGGFAAMQVLPTPTNREITFAIADTGIGLRGSLEPWHSVDDDMDAIRLAFTQGVSGTGERRGEGLFDLLTRVHRRGGQVHVWSGDVRGRIYADSNEWRYDQLTTPYTGTMIYARWTPSATARRK
ncbi:hypothetical protein GOARA_048_01340 [Gordonia araii NBRC 100433]|uniref:STAS domain-containing protein n=1 Tax=Gordonia araii NBRC 100433 TaxID=1073574 RepID=G7H257_9ACTN|nr:hypothetical protein [Gordonia araii]NNG97265.1 hypothetical protein [Gordonia araii NBRC 100433]GAB09932.1 hypothetical protein GOARA_048_01340 [Gordonia araii NBRC 100433]